MEKIISKASEAFVSQINKESSITVFEGENDDEIIFVNTGVDLPHLIFEIEVEHKDVDGTISGKITDISLVENDGESTEVTLSQWHLNTKVMISFKDI